MLQFDLQIRNSLSKIISNDQLEIVMNTIDIISSNYQIKKISIQPQDQQKQVALEFVEQYIRYRKAQGMRQSTVKLYRNMLKIFINEINKPLQNIKKNDVLKWLQNYEQNRNVSKRTLQLYRIIITSFFNWLCAQQYLQKNPTSGIHKIKYQKKPRHALQNDDMTKLRMSCNNIRQKAVIQIMFSTGCRIAQLARLKKQDVDMNTGCVHLYGKGGKYRDSYLSSQAKYILNQYIQERNKSTDFIISSERGDHGVSTAQIRRIVQGVASRCGLDSVTPHIIRHTFATKAIRSGMTITDLQHILGHSNANTTMVYAQVSDQQIKMQHTKCFG